MVSVGFGNASGSGGSVCVAQHGAQRRDVERRRAARLEDRASVMRPSR